MSADRSCGWVLSKLLREFLTDTQASHARQAFLIALTHPTDEVRWNAVHGIGKHLWAFDGQLVLQCVNALAVEAKFVQETYDEESRRPCPNRRVTDDIEAEAASMIRQLFLEPSGIPADAYNKLDPTRWFGAEANARILAILGQAPTESVAITAFEKLAHMLVDWWDEDDERRPGRGRGHRERNTEIESTLRELLEDFLLQTPIVDAIRIIKPIIEAIDGHPDEVHWLLLGFISLEDRQPNTSQFWSLWEQLADGVRRATWLARIDDEHAIGHAMISAVFLNTWWKEGIRHWRSLEGHAEQIHTLFEDLPATSTILGAYLRFLYQIGERSLPEAFIRIAKRLQQGDPRQMLRDANSVFMLEVMLQRCVYGKPLELKRRGDLREAVLLLLDVLIENGSSSAFRMRDDFVTPVSDTAYVY